MQVKHILIPLLIVFAIFSYSCTGEGSGTNGPNRIIPAVEIVQAQFGALPLEERLNGVVRATNQVDIYSDVSAPIEEIYVETGEYVEQGTPLLRLRNTEFQEQLRQAEASLRINVAQRRQAEAALGEVESELRRERILAERELSSEMEIERLEARMESAAASLELANAQIEQAQSAVDEQRFALEQTTIRAPVTGTLGQRNAELGMMVNTSTRLFTIGDLTSSKVTINLTERMLSYITTGQTVQISSENLPDTVLTAQITRISPFLGSGNFSTEAEIEIESTEDLLLPGMFVTVDVFYGESEEATLVPLSAIYTKPQSGETGIYVATSVGMEPEILQDLDDGGSENSSNLSNPTDVEFIPIQVIAEGRDAAGVTGVRNGDWVVTVGQNLIDRDDSEVARVRPVTWESIVQLQQLQPQDLLREIMNFNAASQPGNSSLN